MRLRRPRAACYYVAGLRFGNAPRQRAGARRVTPFDPSPPDPQLPVARPVHAPPAIPDLPGPRWRPSPAINPLTLPGLPNRRALGYLAAVLAVIVLPFSLEVGLALASEPAQPASAPAPQSQPPGDFLTHLDAERPEDPFTTGVLIGWKWVQAALALGLLLFLLRQRDLGPANFGLRGDRVLMQVLLALPTMVGVYMYLIGSTVVVMSLIQLWPALARDIEQRVEFLEAIPQMSSVAAGALFTAVGLHEELLFRGLLLPFLRRLTGSWIAAVAVSCLLFGALHVTQGLIGAVQVTGLAVVLSIVFILSRSLITVVVAHAAFDFVQLQLLVPLIQRITENASAGAGAA